MLYFHWDYSLSLKLAVTVTCAFVLCLLPIVENDNSTISMINNYYILYTYIYYFKVLGCKDLMIKVKQAGMSLINPVRLELSK